MANDYRPIDCSFYDRLEEAATLRRKVEVILMPPDAERQVLHGRIVDFRIRDGAEWAILQDGRSFQLDWIHSLDGQVPPKAC